MTTLRDIYDIDPPTFAERTENAIKEIARSHPDYVYAKIQGASCFYTGPQLQDRVGKFACIFGEAWTKLGWDDPTEMEKMLPVIELLDSFKIPSPQHWADIQLRQDSGWTWGNIAQTFMGEA